MDQNKLNEVVKAQAEIYKPAIQEMLREANEHDCKISQDSGCDKCPI